MITCLCKSLPAAFLMMIPMLLWLPVLTGAADQKKTLVLLETMPVPVVLEHSKWFLDEMSVLGYIPGKNLDLIRYNADGDRHKARAFIDRCLADKKPDLVVTNATLATQEAMTILGKQNIPHLFFTVADPVGSGLVSQINIPTGKNMTGRVYSLNHLAKLKNVLRLLDQIPHKKPIRLGIIHSTYPSASGEAKKLIQEVQDFDGLTCIAYQIPYQKVPEGVPAMLKEVKAGIEKLESQVDYWWEVAGPLGEIHEFNQMFHFFSSHPVVMCNTLEAVKHIGSLLYMSPDAEKYGRETAAVAHAILTGTDPGVISVTTPSSFLLAINLKTALKLGIVIPSDMFYLAGKHIY